MKHPALLLPLLVAAAFAQQTTPVVATSTFYDVEDENNRAFVEFSKNSTKKLIEAAMKDDPGMRSATLTVRIFGGNPSPEGRYRMVIVRDGFPSMNPDALTPLYQKATGMTQDEYQKKAASLRETTGATLRQRVASTSGDSVVALAEGDIIRTDLKKIAPDRAADYYNMERNDYLPIHTQMLKDGKIKSWTVWSFRSPAGADRAADAVTTTVFKDLTAAMTGLGYPATYAKVFPNGNFTTLSNRARTVVSSPRIDYWRVVWSISR